MEQFNSLHDILNERNGFAIVQVSKSQLKQLINFTVPGYQTILNGGIDGQEYMYIYTIIPQTRHELISFLQKIKSNKERNNFLIFLTEPHPILKPHLTLIDKSFKLNSLIFNEDWFDIYSFVLTNYENKEQDLIDDIRNKMFPYLKQNGKETLIPRIYILLSKYQIRLNNSTQKGERLLHLFALCSELHELTIKMFEI